MTEQPEPQNSDAQNSEPRTSDPHGGLSASGRTADQFEPGDSKGTDYGAAGAVADDAAEVSSD